MINGRIVVKNHHNIAIKWHIPQLATHGCGEVILCENLIQMNFNINFAFMWTATCEK